MSRNYMGITSAINPTPKQYAEQTETSYLAKERGTERNNRITVRSTIICKRERRDLYISPIDGTIVRLLIIALVLSKLGRSLAVIFTCKSSAQNC